MNRQLHRWHCALRDLLRVKPPETRSAVQSAEIDEKSLRESYAASALSDRADDTVLYRIIGNDLPPRHEMGQSLRSLKFILENETQFPDCRKAFLLNRVIDSAQEEAILDQLERSGYAYSHLKFDPVEYAKIPLDYGCLPKADPDYLASRTFRRLRSRHKLRLLTAVNRLRNLYVMNNNGARNHALQAGRREAKWVMPFDGNCYFTKEAWRSVSDAISKRPWMKHFVVPMARIHDNQQLLNPSFLPAAHEEPQLVFRCDTKACFNEAFSYGRFPKVEMFWHLGIPGTWSYTVEKAWDPKSRDLSEEAHAFALAGWVARLNSGVGTLEVSGHQMGSVRGDARRSAILKLFFRLDHEHKGACEFEKYLPVAIRQNFNQV